VVVYVTIDPAGTLPPITLGTNSCSACDAVISGVVAATLTDETGAFKLEDVPTGQNIPLVVQVGKWRREIIIPATNDCADTPLTNGTVRLPRKKSEGDMPQMALLTGGSDPLGCFLLTMGIDASEFTDPSQGGRLHVYRGFNGADVANGTAPDCYTNDHCPLWSTKSALERYDIVVLACEASPLDSAKPDKVPMHDWVNEGGKLFASHYQFTWFLEGPPDFKGVANWTPDGLNYSGPFKVDTTFPKGNSFLKWLQYVGATTNDTLPLGDVRNDLTTVNAGAQRWVYTPQNGGKPEFDRYISFNTPIGGIPSPPDAGPSYCGKAVFSDIHVAEDESYYTIPTTCKGVPWTGQEKALEFLFFDLSACVQNDALPPVPPTVR
jgi:hypothetical protein